MDGESSCESDISESWSLIDINLNEESLSIAESCSELEKNSKSDLRKEKSSEKDLEDFVRRCKEINNTDFNGLSDSDSDASFNNQGLPTCGTNDGIDAPFKENLNNDVKHDSGDAESIEILDMDDSEIDRLDASGFHHFDFPTYQSDDEESLEGNIDNENRSINSSVIKRRRRRANKSSEEIVHSVNSESRSPAVDNSSTSSSIDTKKVSQKLSEESKKANSHPVYKHYRNNFANTVLSLSVGVIFAGVACIAIGHFLGVQDASESAVELTETLKKLQVENAALQSRLFHLNRALLTRETNSKLELPLNEPHNTVPFEKTPNVYSINEETNLNNAALSEIRSSLNSIEWLSKLEDFVRKNNKVTDTEYGVDFNGFGKFIHDQLCTLNIQQNDGAKILKETDKISKVLQKVINRLSSSQDHIEKLYERLLKFKDKLNNKVQRVFPESSIQYQSEKSKRRRKLPVTELDLQTMNWHSKNEIDEGSDALNSESAVLYKFPQPENYYNSEKDFKQIIEQVVKEPYLKKEIKNEDFEKAEKVENRDKKKHKITDEKKEDIKHAKDNSKKKRFKEKESKEKKGGKKRKRNANKGYKFIKNVEKDQKNKDRDEEQKKHKILSDNQNVFNETVPQNKKYSRTGERVILSKHMLKKFKKFKMKKLLSKLKKRSHFKKDHHNPLCPGCFNLTGDWIFKWAGGRENFRRHESLGDWQFERAKARREMREGENEKESFENWQFKRAEARENNRNHIHHGHNQKYSKYLKKDFVHEGFSWF